MTSFDTLLESISVASEIPSQNLLWSKHCVQHSQRARTMCSLLLQDIRLGRGKLIPYTAQGLRFWSSQTLAHFLGKNSQREKDREL